MELSIIVPVYQVEEYVHRCLESIYNQGLEDERFEVIIVNDGTRDRSMEVIADIIDQHDNITVINQENQGQSVARNNGMAIAKGEYILMPDSDDLLVENSVPPLLQKALETKADMVVAEFLIMNNKEIEERHPIARQATIMKEKTGEELYLEYLHPNQYYIWRVLFRKSFLEKNNLRFHPNIYFEDIPFLHEAYLKANKCIKASCPIYIYRRGHSSISDAESFNTRKAKDFCIAIAKTWELNKTLELSPKLQEKFFNCIYASYCNLLYRILFKLDKMSDKVEVLEYFHQLAPDLKFTYSLKQKIGNVLYEVSPRLYIIVQKWAWKY